MKNTRQVNTVLMHLHLDEVTAYYLATTVGDHYFTGIKAAKVEFTSKVAKKTPSQWAELKILSLGAGGDIDEHRNGERARVEETCAAVIMAETLTIQNGPIWDIIREVNWFDGNIGCPKSHLASLFKAMQVGLDGFDKAALRWSMKILSAVQANLETNLPAPVGEKSFLAFVKDIVRNKKSVFTDDDALHGLLGLLETEAKVKKMFLLGLRNIYESLWRTARSAEDRADVTEHLLFALDILYQDQTRYHTYARYIKSLNPQARENVWFPIDVADGLNRTSIKAAAVRTDNPQAHTVLRSLGAVISIVMNSHGNVTIQGDKRYAHAEWLRTALDVGVVNLCAMNRFADMAPAARKGAVWPMLQSRGNCPGDNYWYLADKGWLAMFNGTRNHESPPTRLALAQLRKNASNAFDPIHVSGWIDFMRVPKVDMKMEFGLSGRKGLGSLAQAFDHRVKHVSV